MDHYISKYPSIKAIDFSDKYDKMVAYEIKDKTIYKNMGGGHMYVIGIERNAPKYPGMLLEEPIPLPRLQPSETTYFRPAPSKDRFTAKIFYTLILDSCEDINEQSFAVFKTLFDHQIIIE